MRVLILGAKGALGQTFVDVYKGEEIFAWDREELDITDEEMVMQKISELKPDLIINCAAYNAVDRAEEDRATAELLNGSAVGYIAKAASAVNATLVHFSTAYVFDGNNPEGYNEDDKPSAHSAYAKSKLLGEMELPENCENYYLIRTTWLYGRLSERGKPSFVDTMLKLSKDQKEIKVISDEFGQPTFVQDLAEATKALVDQEKPFGIYHIVNSGMASWYDWAKEIFKIKGLDIKLETASRDAFVRLAERPKYGILNNTKFIQLRPWHEALKDHLK
ncbi:MAG: dTDP-4-dehydrorhamnose reductase [Candidatus Doudnabacteria bacterium RIFCSPLOWO2_02_FULL_42_9]|uniref:dTDP-4-dehydrorhamnose reductase n=1 Tax=Candidatus Doudnabacteria bacterium RIFCSPHIGHO2_01_FULL_41_86 TaxID=1817821 RepID=A0A1F5N7P4_9BACT|nr:MAG: dTDP-4-dehydrorhamnose reductase [Candidatus Doudnabacteria bacterium RIFCSPHIGHO2_01_FULL_41_86]OGE74735.1 MAG: dTDP-4-dehydrorhamnose reductase [Candidatus Doudnabacteria bacterium RIFCSPHIGHO2_01_43_10]OGE85701.1 MAG: dTDP-4-dehydrorhamnose reductase [Candidatus Doudnabacteria bacterium RIFCSPHIGHO2_12_FULL_42_22]OGE87196.1 MAG: dTDP-4-dehydrorhamnose reductase [Candidatus Doudnabacteria bacterium RIFCSPHIGHO2_02_FULL_42_25]OGE92034.1 MAG: dTDP-4-dehydrorhamnose reductase [Candidatus